MEAALILVKSKAARCVKQGPCNVYVLFDADTFKSYKSKQTPSFIIKASDSDFLRW